MLLPEQGEELAAALVNAALLALWAALPLLIAGYVRQTVAARRLRAEFSLRKSESCELQRAIRLYGQVSRRLEEIESHAERVSLWRALFRGGAGAEAADAEEREDLRAHAEHLHAAIVRIKRRPLRRLQTWIHTMSARCAFGRAVAAYGLAFALLIAALYTPGQPAWADELGTGASGVVTWYPLDARLFYANAAAAGFAGLAAVLFYLTRRLRLRRNYEMEFCVFKDLADSDPQRLIEAPAFDQPAADAPPLADGARWFAVLGVSPAATVAEVKDAYKTLIKQNHPDRVHGMAPAFRKLAEAETMRINAAYRQALAEVAAFATAA